MQVRLTDYKLLKTGQGLVKVELTDINDDSMVLIKVIPRKWLNEIIKRDPERTVYEYREFTNIDYIPAEYKKNKENKK